MKFEVYCDESNPDVLTSKKPKAQFLMIGSLWLPSSQRNELKESIQLIRKKHEAWGEIKWSKISPTKINFYLDLIILFFSLEKNLRFRCIAVERKQLNMELINNDEELGFYKFYYQLLHHWILDFNEYSIFCDIKTNRDNERLPELSRCLSHSNLSSNIKNIQFLPSHDVVIIQLCDLLLGAASSRLNATLKNGSPKEMVVSKIEELLGQKLMPTPKSEEKFNIFKIQLSGGW